MSIEKINNLFPKPIVPVQGVDKDKKREERESERIRQAVEARKKAQKQAEEPEETGRIIDIRV